MRFVALLALLLPLAAEAQEIVFTPEATEACLATESARESCVGLSAEACNAPPGVNSNFALGVCLRKEAEYWDVRLAAAFRALVGAETSIMAEMRSAGATVPDTVAPLRASMDAWAAYRDAACAYEYSTWGGGSGGGPGHADCIMRLTARQALEIERRLEERSG